MRLGKDIQTKLAKFKADKRAFRSFLILSFAFILTLPTELLCNVRPIVLSVDGSLYFPIFKRYSERDFGGILPSEPDYKSKSFISLLSGVQEPEKTVDKIEKTNSIELDDFEEDSLSLGMDDFEDESVKEDSLALDMNDFEDEINISTEKAPATSETKLEDVYKPSKPRDYWIIWPPIRYDYRYIPTESKIGVVALAAPYETKSYKEGKTILSSWVDGHYLGTDDRGRDVLARLIYGFRISLIFGLSLAITGTIVGCMLGGVQGYFGGWIDLIGQRFIEIWGSMPRLYLLIILSSLLTPSLLLLFFILNLTAWMGIAAYIRAEFLKSRNLEYVKAAKAMGVSNFEIMRRHILPNSLTPVVTFFPFEVTAGILALVSLDYLNLGVPSPSPSMGELLAQGKNNLQADWIILPTFLTLTITLSLLTFVGEGVRNAFDPKKN
jgi:ABC-type microcin C transport system permease subunit YejE